MLAFKEERPYDIPIAMKKSSIIDDQEARLGLFLACPRGLDRSPRCVVAVMVAQHSNPKRAGWLTPFGASCVLIVNREQPPGRITPRDASLWRSTHRAREAETITETQRERQGRPKVGRTHRANGGQHMIGVCNPNRARNAASSRRRSTEFRVRGEASAQRRARLATDLSSPTHLRGSKQQQ
jgi:hypothetical protein